MSIFVFLHTSWIFQWRCVQSSNPLHYKRCLFHFYWVFSLFPSERTRNLSKQIHTHLFGPNFESLCSVLPFLRSGWYSAVLRTPSRCNSLWSLPTASEHRSFFFFSRSLSACSQLRINTFGDSRELAVMLIGNGCPSQCLCMVLWCWEWFQARSIDAGKTSIRETLTSYRNTSTAREPETPRIRSNAEREVAACWLDLGRTPSRRGWDCAWLIDQKKANTRTCSKFLGERRDEIVKEEISGSFYYDWMSPLSTYFELLGWWEWRQPSQWYIRESCFRDRHLCGFCK